MAVFHTGITKSLPIFGALHVISHVPFIEPNILSNTYHRVSPIGRGYGAHSTRQLLQIDCIKTKLGSNFDYRDIIDTKSMVGLR